MSGEIFDDDSGFDDLYDKLEVTADDVNNTASKKNSRRRSRSRSRSKSRSKAEGGRSKSAGRRSSSAKPSRSKSRTRSKSSRNLSDGPKSDDFELTSEDMSHDAGTEGTNEKKKKTKLEKIEQLQAKNSLYKEEFKRVQKDRKQLKKELETKNGEIDSLNNEIDQQTAEISRLKSQLSDALHRSTATAGAATTGTSEDASELNQLYEKYQRTKTELDRLTQKEYGHRQEMEDIKVAVQEKEDEIRLLKDETAELRKEIRQSQDENRKLKSKSVEVSSQDKQIAEMEEERARLQAELQTTVDSASVMVKEREEAIADLLKENDELKSLIASKEMELEEKKLAAESDDTEDPIAQVRQEQLGQVRRELEESQDRNVLLEEELESWTKRGDDMEKEIVRLKDELEQSTEKLNAAKQNAESSETRAMKAMEDATVAKVALEEATEDFQTRMTEVSMKHKAAILEVKSKYAEQQNDGAGDAQAEALRSAVAKRQQAGDNKSSWFGFGGGDGAKSDDATDDEKAEQIRDLMSLSQQQETEIKTLKSDLVQLRTTSNENNYKNKKVMERLEHENETYAQRVAELEQRIKELESS
mmetsp:Transcript_20189/g.43604  ORF Transcript_20189/g.43604 Transcript_20189/m.43604 type:complete len:587 (-) Transcript_20189:223-1983(-)